MRENTASNQNVYPMELSARDRQRPLFTVGFAWSCAGEIGFPNPPLPPLQIPRRIPTHDDPSSPVPSVQSRLSSICPHRLRTSLLRLIRMLSKGRRIVPNPARFAIVWNEYAVANSYSGNVRSQIRCLSFRPANNAAPTLLVVPGTTEQPAFDVLRGVPFSANAPKTGLSPPIRQAIYNKIAGFPRIAIHDIELFLLDFQDAKRNQQTTGNHVVIQCLHRRKTTQLAAARKLAQFDLCLRID